MKIRPAGRERLAKLATLLMTVPDKHFDMSVWRDGEDCGTAACAVGHAAMDPWFNARGLKLQKRNKLMSRPGHSWIPFFQGRTRKYLSLKAAQAFFGLSYEDAGHLFLPRKYRNEGLDVKPSTVARRIRTLLKKQAALQ